METFRLSMENNERQREREREREKTTAHLEQNADAEVHEGLGEVDDGLAGVVDRHGSHGQVGFLRRSLGSEGGRT